MKVKRISSAQNPFFKKLLRLKGSCGVKKYGVALLSGEKNVKEVVKYFPKKCVGLITYGEELLNSIIPKAPCPVYLLNKELFRLIDFHGTLKPVAIIEADGFEQWNEGVVRRGCSLFIPFQDPANIGAAIRCAAAFGVETVVLLKEAAHPFHHKSLRASGTTVFRVELMTGPSIYNVAAVNLPLVALHPKGKDITTYRFPETFALLAGLEGPGVPEEVRCTARLAIPIEKGVESLNAAMAVGIALYQWRMLQGRYG